MKEQNKQYLVAFGIGRIVRIYHIYLTKTRKGLKEYTGKEPRRKVCKTAGLPNLARLNCNL